MFVHQTTPFTESTAVPISTLQTHINDINALIASPPETPFINKASDSSTKPWKAQTRRVVIEIRPAESPAAQPSARSHEVVKNTLSATTTAPGVSVTPPTHSTLLAQLGKTLPTSFTFNSNINSSSGLKHGPTLGY